MVTMDLKCKGEGRKEFKEMRAMKIDFCGIK
jgi:hypothetical protein